MPSLRAIEQVAQVAEPAASELAAAAASKVSEWVGSIPAREGMWHLPRQRFLRPGDDSAALDAVPTGIDWQARKSELSEAIARRIMEPRLTEQQFFEPVREFPEHDRQIVTKILDLSAGSSTETGLMYSINSIALQLEQRFHGQLRRSFAASPESPGNMLAYLFRKSRWGGATFHFDYRGVELASAGNSEPFLVFDDLQHLKDADRTALMELQARHPIVAMNVASFERAVNFIDFAHGQPTVVAKLDRLLKETKDLMAKEPSLEQEQAIKRVLDDGFEQSVEAVNRQAAPGVNPIITMRSEPVAPLLALKPVVTPPQVVSFLEEQFWRSSGARIAAAELLAENVEFHTLQGLVPKLKDLKEALRLSAQRRNVDPEKDMFVVAAESGQASSDAFMTYLYKQATGLSDERIVTLKQLQALQKEGKLGDRRVVALDDAIYNGWQAEDLVNVGLARFPHVALSAVSSLNRFARRMHEGYFEQQGPARVVRELVTLQTDFPLGVAPNGAASPHYSRMLENDRLQLGAVDPVKENQSLTVFPHMTSDTSPLWLMLFAKRFPLTFLHAPNLK